MWISISSKIFLGLKTYQILSRVVYNFDTQSPNVLPLCAVICKSIYIPLIVNSILMLLRILYPLRERKCWNYHTYIKYEQSC